MEYSIAPGENVATRTGILRQRDVKGGHWKTDQQTVSIPSLKTEGMIRVSMHASP